MSGSARSLATLRVLDLTDELAAQGARMLVGLGADVVRVLQPSQANATRAQLLHWHAGKRIVMVDRDTMLDEVADDVDVVLESGPLTGLAGVRIDGGLASSRWPATVHVVVTPFGLSGPRKHWTADDLVVSAAGGMAWLGGRPDGPPKPPPREQAVQLAGTHAAIGALLGVLAADRDDAGQLIDISAQEATAATLETAAISWIHAGKFPSRNGGVYDHVAHRIFAASDGYVAGGYSGSDRMWTDLLAWLAECGGAADLSAPEWADPVYRWAGRAHVDEVVAAFVADRTVAAIAEQGLKRALPWAEVAMPATLLDNPQLRDRRFFTRIDGPTLPSGGVYDVGSPFESIAMPRPVQLSTATPVTAVSWPNRAPRAKVTGHRSPTNGRPALRGLRVLDLTWVLAGPYATKTLAEHGADVIKVESLYRQDPTRFAPSMRLRPHAGFDDSGYFMNFNRGKRSIAVNLRTDRGQELVRDLAAECDVMIENFSPGVLARWGMSYPQLVERNPEVILVSMAGAGQTGPWRDAVTFADTLAAMSGLSSETADPGGPPQGLTFGLGDMIAANAAVLAVLDHLLSGRGGHVDLSQLEAMVASMGTAVLETQLAPRGATATARWPNRHPTRVPHGTYPTRGDDRWIAVAVFDDEAWHALCTVADLPALRELDTAVLLGRIMHQEAIDEAIADWTARQDGDDLVERLQRAGVAAAVVNNGKDLVEADPQLAARGFYQGLRHPIAGTVIHEGMVIRMGRTPGALTTAAPLLGQHSVEVLREWLGLREAELTELVEAEVLQ